MIDVYFRMLALDLDGAAYNKTKFRQELLREIDRSNGSAEFKFQNISAVLMEIGAVAIPGYKPRYNAQQMLRERVVERFERESALRSAMLRSVEREPDDRRAIELPLEPMAPPSVGEREMTQRERSARHIDFQRVEASNRRLGLAGERAVVDLERFRLRRSGRDDLADRVRHVSVEDGDGLGFDVLSFTPGGSERFLEVKTTRGSEFQPFFVSRNEVAFSQEADESFTLIRLFRFERASAGYYELHGPVPASTDLRVESYSGLPRRAHG